MASFKLNHEYRDKLFFNKYQYRASCRLPGVRYTYYCNTVDDFVKKVYRSKINLWTNRRDYDDIDYASVGKFIDWRNEYKKDMIIRIEHDSFSVFSNDIELLKTLTEICKDVRFAESIVIAPNIKFFKQQPDFNYRVYLKGLRLDTDKAEQVCSFVNNYIDRPNVNISKALVNAVKLGRIRSNRWMHNSYFIDYNEESMITLLKLIFPEILASKIYKLDSISNKHKYSDKMEYLDGENS